MSVIVVSDTHLGDETQSDKDFSKFIDWIAELEKEGGKTIKSDGKEILLKPPEKLILLGDILELWSPRDEDMKYTMQEGVEPFGKLVGLGCEKIFVLGNHDEGIADYLDVAMKSKEGKEIKENNFKINNTEFRIINRHYPEDPEDRTKGFLKIGNYKYFFIHGQQFDKLFIRLGYLSSAPTYIARLSNAFSKIFIPDGWSIVAAFIVLLILYSRFKNDALLTFTVVSFLLSIPRLFTYFQDKFWVVFRNALANKPKYKDIKTIVEEKYYDVDADTTDWDVNIVFGHTHMPEIRPYRPDGTGEDHEWLFLNTGSWTLEKGNYNTFIYLDENGYYLFKWDRCDGIELIPPGEIFTD